jgi:hypothetical protein
MVDEQVSFAQSAVQFLQATIWNCREDVVLEVKFHPGSDKVVL